MTIVDGVQTAEGITVTEAEMEQVRQAFIKAGEACAKHFEKVAMDIILQSQKNPSDALGASATSQAPGSPSGCFHPKREMCSGCSG